MEKFKFLEHTADVKFQAFGKNLPEVFENCVLALSNILSNNDKIKSVKKKTINIEGGDDKKFLYNLLEEVIYLLDAEDFITSKAKVNFDEKVRQLRVIFYGDDSKKYKSLNQVKSPTYNDMFIKKQKNKFTAQVVLDV
ncbi:MAG: archease [Nanoarchaeota archaeon]